MSDPEARPRLGRRRFPLLVLGLVSACAVLGGVVYWGTGDEAPKREHCDGYLTDDNLTRLLGEGANDADPTWTSYADTTGRSHQTKKKERGDISRCALSLPNGDVGEFVTSTALEPGPYQPVSQGVVWYEDSAPLGSALPGWTEPGRSVVMLPEECTEKFSAQGKPVQVTFRAMRAYWGDVLDPDRRVLAEALVSYASTMAELKGCGGDDLRLTGEVPEVPAPEPLPDGGHCGLSGFAATRPQEDGPSLEQTVVGDPSDSWSCVVGLELAGEESLVPAAFAVTSHREFIDQYDSAAHADQEDATVEVLACADQEYLLVMAFAAPDPEESVEEERQRQELAESRLKPKEELYGDFVAAARKSLGCPA
ncbi:hypothetical protein [Streptomyces chumphonensis]|uniref:hypothetical protein n=1 Tax=Streptomyces chumphonensis TaxID=1214925 RepID=UPI003D734D4E